MVDQSSRAVAPPIQSQNESVITRVFDAPRHLVYQVWTQPEHIMRWWGPKGFTAPVCKLDLRPGGEFLFCMRSPEGQDFWSKGTFREIVAPERIVYVDAFADANGNEVPASHYGLGEDWPEATLVTVTFAQQGSKTKVTLVHAGIPESDAGMTVAGWNETLDKVADVISAESTGHNETTLAMPSDLEIVITRDFNAPRHLVFEAWTQPEHVKRWYGPKRLTLSVCDIDLRVGGKWRWVLREPDGSDDYAFSGEYREIVPPERLVCTECYEAMPGTDYLVTATFTERDGKTTLRSHILYQSKEHRDGHMRSGMEAGMRETLDRLAELVESMA